MEIDKNASATELRQMRVALDDAIAVARCNEEGHPSDFLHVKVDDTRDDAGLPTGRPGLPVTVECARCGMQWPVAPTSGAGQWTPLGDVEDAREAIAHCKDLVERNFASA
jgi:hypothetical protein